MHNPRQSSVPRKPKGMCSRDLIKDKESYLALSSIDPIFIRTLALDAQEGTAASQTALNMSYCSSGSTKCSCNLKSRWHCTWFNLWKSVPAEYHPFHSHLLPGACTKQHTLKRHRRAKYSRKKTDWEQSLSDRMYLVVLSRSAQLGRCPI